MRQLAILLFALSPIFAGTPPAGFTEAIVASNLNSPTAFAFAPDGRIFICEQAGNLRVVKNGALLATPFVSLSVDSSGERGLLGIAFDPNFAVNNFVYLYYTVPSNPRHNRVSRFTASGDVAATNSESILLELDDLSGATNHNGGAMHFGPDGKLYIAVGENANGANSQVFTNLLGKILRMNSDGSIPVDNPFPGAVGRNRLIWALGLRNPFTFNFDQQSSRLFINDVGQNTWEEVNIGRAGANYGWPTTEGVTTNPAFDSPLYAYNHGGASPTGCAITGGAFYNPLNPVYPATYVGKYFFADFCSGWIYYINTTAPATPVQFLIGASSPVDIQTGPDAKLYYLQRSPGSLRRIDTSSTLPSITSQPSNIQVSVGQPATFTVSATGQGLSYQWRRGTTDINGATSSSYTFPNAQLSDSGSVFSVRVQNAAGGVDSDPAVLTVVPRRPPAVTITSPVQGALFSGGDTIVFNGSGTDQDNNAINPSTFLWRVDYITGAATRPFVQPFTGAGGSFLVPSVTPYLLTDVYFLIYLTVTDSQGLSTTVNRRVDPRISEVSLTTVPTGLQLTLDGQPITAPLTFSSVVGLIRPIGAPGPQGTGGTRYLFSNWSDGGAATHNIVVGLTNSSYTANYTTQHLLTTQASSGGTVSPGGWFNAGSTTSVTATPNTGWVFTGFSGDLTGSANPQNVLMDRPKSVTARFAALQPSLLLQLTAKTDSGTPGVRAWTIQLTNNGQGPALNARISRIDFNPTGKGTVSLVSPLPVSFGTINPGTSASRTILVNFPLTTPATRAAVTYTIEADGGYSVVVRLKSQFR